MSSFFKFSLSLFFKESEFGIFSNDQFIMYKDGQIAVVTVDDQSARTLSSGRATDSQTSRRCSLTRRSLGGMLYFSPVCLTLTIRINRRLSTFFAECSFFPFPSRRVTGQRRSPNRGSAADNSCSFRRLHRRHKVSVRECAITYRKS